MIQPPGQTGVVFSEASEGDMRGDEAARARLRQMAGIPTDWATVNQVHGRRVVRATNPGEAGDADAIWTTAKDLALAVFTADCFGVVLTGPGCVGVAHAGWRGARAHVVTALRQAMREDSHDPIRAYVGPGIGACCFEVGDDVSSQFPGHRNTTSWGSASVDLPEAIAGELSGMEIWTADRCTNHDMRFFSHRRDGTAARMAAVGWNP